MTGMEILTFSYQTFSFNWRRQGACREVYSRFSWWPHDLQVFIIQDYYYTGSFFILPLVQMNLWQYFISLLSLGRLNSIVIFLSSDLIIDTASKCRWVMEHKSLITIVSKTLMVRNFRSTRSFLWKEGYLWQGKGIKRARLAFYIA